MYTIFNNLDYILSKFTLLTYYHSQDIKNNKNDEDNSEDDEFACAHHCFTDEECRNMIMDAGIVINDQYLTVSDIDKLLMMIPLIVEAHRSGKCIAILMNCHTVAIAVSGLWWRGQPFIVPSIDDAIALARDMGCFQEHWKDGDKPGQYYACHAEVQMRMYFLKKNEISINTNSDEDTDQVQKVFQCRTSLSCCNNCVKFFNKAAVRFKPKVKIVINQSHFVGR